MSDRQAAQAVRSRIDWQYVLRLGLAADGFDAAVLSAFGGRLLAHGAVTRRFDALLARCCARGFLKAGGGAPTRPTPGGPSGTGIAWSWSSRRCGTSSMASWRPTPSGRGRTPMPRGWSATSDPGADGDMTPAIHAALEAEHLLPREHVVDIGYLDAELLVSSKREYGVDLVGPTRPDDHRQAQERTGFALEVFRSDWERHQAICPEGHASNSSAPAPDRRSNPAITVKVSGRDCRRCPSRERCTRSQKQYPWRTSTIREREEFAALLAARRRARTGAYRAAYAKRAGCTGTLSRGVRRCRLRRTRYLGEERTHLGHVLTAAGLDVVRLGEWFAGTPAPKRVPRHSRH